MAMRFWITLMAAVFVFAFGGARAADAPKKNTHKKHDTHADHKHGAKDCKHKAEKHGSHIDYEDDGHHHKKHGSHYDECDGPENDPKEKAKTNSEDKTETKSE